MPAFICPNWATLSFRNGPAVLFPFGGREVRLDVNIDDGRATEALLDRVRLFLSDADGFDRLARDATRSDFKKAEGSATILSVAPHRPVRCGAAKAVFRHRSCRGLGVDQLLALVQLVRIGLYPNGPRQFCRRAAGRTAEAVFDYPIREATDYLLVATFDAAGNLARLAIESQRRSSETEAWSWPTSDTRRSAARASR
jgi:hypothetical protein